MKKTYRILFLFYIFISPIHSIGQTWNWAKQSTGSSTTGYNLPSDIVLDANKNSYVVGQFDSPLAFGSVTLSPTLKNIFVAKFDSLGTCLWASKAGAFNVSGGNSITIDQNGDLIICGSFYGTANFGTFTINSNGNSDMFIAKIDNGGTWQWVKSYGGSSYDYGSQITSDINNNIYLAGVSVGTFMFDTCQVNGLGGYDAFLGKFDSSGQCIWVKNTLGIGNEKGTCISISTLGTIYLGGVYSGDPIVFGDTLNSIGQMDEYDFISKFDTTGNKIWTKQLSCGAMNNMSGISSIATDNNDNVYFTGNFAYSCTLDAFVFNAPTTAVRNSYIAKLDSSSNVVWAKKGLGPTNNWGSAIFVDSEDYSYVTGFYTDTVNFSDCSSINTGGNGYMIKLDSLGNCMCINNVKNITPSSIVVDSSNIWLTGFFSNTALFGTYTLSTANPTEIFVANSTICPVYTGISDLSKFENNFLIYPNPSREFFNIQNIECEKFKVEIFNSFGQLVDGENINKSEQINISKLKQGIYYVKVFCDKKYESRILIKQ